jgi:uncharacterized membrane protein YdjX (TVP38/TMEM64 family)
MSRESTPVNLPLEYYSEDDEDKQNFRCSILEEETAEETNGRICPVSKRTLLAVILSVLCSILVLIFLRSHLFDFLNWLQEAPLYETLIVFFILFTIVAFPIAFGYLILNVAAGYVYGFWWGMLVVILSVAMGFTISFFVCRTFLRDTINRQIKSSKLATAFVRIVEGKRGFKVILLARLTPVPFGIQNSILAVTDIRYVVCFVSSMIGSLPTQCLNTYMGSTLRDMAEVLTHRADGYIILGVQILITAVLSMYVVRLAYREFKKMANSNENSVDGASPPV